MKKTILLVGISLICLTSHPVYSIEKTADTAPEQKNIAPSKSPEVQIRIFPGDILNIDIYEENDLSGDFEVKEDETISYPLLGSVKVAGLTKSEVESLLTKLLGDDYLVSPFVQITIKPSKKLENMPLIMVLGAVQRPSSYAFPQDQPMSLLQAISLAGGFTNRASIKETKIIRTGASGEKVTLDPQMELILKGEKKDIELQRNDLVSVPEKLESMVMVLGCVQRPGSFPLHDNRPTTLLQGIALAGGFTGFANIGGTKIIRTTPESKKIILDPDIEDILSGKKQDVELQADDLISVPERFF